MEENKKELEGQGPANGEGGRKRRHHRRGHGNGGNSGNNQNAEKVSGEKASLGNGKENTAQNRQGDGDKKNQPANNNNNKQKNNKQNKQQKPQKQQNEGGRDKTNAHPHAEASFVT